MAITAATLNSDFSGFLNRAEAQPYFELAAKQSIMQRLARHCPDIQTAGRSVATNRQCMPQRHGQSDALRLERRMAREPFLEQARDFERQTQQYVGRGRGTGVTGGFQYALHLRVGQGRKVLYDGANMRFTNVPAYLAARSLALGAPGELPAEPIEIGIFLRDNLRQEGSPS